MKPAPKSEPWRRDLFALAVKKARGEPLGPYADIFTDGELRGPAIKDLEAELGGKLELGTPFAEGIIADRILRIRRHFAVMEYCDSQVKRRPGRPATDPYEAFVLLVACTRAEDALAREGKKVSERQSAARAARMFGDAVSSDRLRPRRVKCAVLRVVNFAARRFGQRDIASRAFDIMWPHVSAAIDEAEAELRAIAAEKSGRKLA